MIQEPPSQHQSDSIELPMVSRDSMNLSYLTTPALDTTTTTTTNPLSCKNRTTIIQIPKQNSKPRIFLLTRPAKPPLVRIATPAQTVLAHQNQNDHSAKNNHRATIPKIVRIPFLTRYPTKNEGIQGPKKDLAPQQYQPLKDLNQITIVPRSQSELKLKDSLIIHQEIIQAPKSKDILPLSSAPASSRVDQHQVLTKIRPESVKNSIKTTIQENTVNLAKKKINEPIMQSTLASMAGIELTGADMSHTAADMSGAMPPTATVEEINVPVFIDEYLQQAAISTTAASVTTQNINYNINNNNNSSISNNNNPSNGKGNDNDVVNACLDTFENFEFDIELLTENNSKDQDKARLHDHHHHQQQQQQLAEDDIQQQQPQNNLDNSIEDNNIEEDKDKQKQQLQLMLEEILFSSNNNSCCHNNNNSNILNTSIFNNNDNINKMANSMFEDCFNPCDEDIFNVAPTSQNLDYDEIDIFNISSTNENAVDFNQPNNECLSLMELGGVGDDESTNTSYYINSCDIMLRGDSIASSTNLKSFPLASALSQEISTAEPHVSPDQIHYPNSSFSLTTAAPVPAPSPPLSFQSDLNDSIDRTDSFRDVIAAMMDCSESKVNPIKRNSAAQTKKHMEEKRSKLRLDTKRRMEVETMPQHQEIDTPSIINSILQNEESMSDISPAENSMDIFIKLINSPHESIVKSEVEFGDNTNDISPPYTPQSVNSTSNQTNFTGFISTAPNSPASSIATTNTTSATTRRGRGRPAKLHSDMPDISKLNHLPESEQKKLLERAKNNEASRKSRLKNKERDIAIEREERELTLRNEQLRIELHNMRKIERKFRRALKRQHSPY